MNSNFRKIVATMLLGAFILNISACNTMAGVGKDTKKAGEKIEKEADRHVDEEKKEKDNK